MGSSCSQQLEEELGSKQKGKQGAGDERAGQYFGMQKKQQVAETEKATGGKTEGEDIKVHTLLPLLHNSALANSDTTIYSDSTDTITVTIRQRKEITSFIDGFLSWGVFSKTKTHGLTRQLCTYSPALLRRMIVHHVDDAARWVQRCARRQGNRQIAGMGPEAITRD